MPSFAPWQSETRSIRALLSSGRSSNCKGERYAYPDLFFQLPVLVEGALLHLRKKKVCQLSVHVQHSLLLFQLRKFCYCRLKLCGHRTSRSRIGPVS